MTGTKQEVRVHIKQYRMMAMMMITVIPHMIMTLLLPIVSLLESPVEQGSAQIVNRRIRPV
jgi:hypothetical protein